MDSSLSRHWDSVYSQKDATGVSWFQARPAASLELIASVGARHDDAIIDVGGGASTLVDCLLSDGFLDVTVLDVSSVALGKAQERLGKEQASRVHWKVQDVTRFDSDAKFQVWHDRAVLHFLSKADEQLQYVQSLKRNLRKGGYFILGTFAVGGASECSNLDVVQYDRGRIVNLLGPEFDFVRERQEDHVTPLGTIQPFWYGVFQFNQKSSAADSYSSVVDAEKMEAETLATYSLLSLSSPMEASNVITHFHCGIEYAVKVLSYDRAELDALPEGATGRFCGLGNPLGLGPLPRGAVVVDHACGSGVDVLLAAKKGARIVYGIDMNPDVRAVAERNVREAHLEGKVQILSGRMEKIPLEDGIADVLISNGVLNLSLCKSVVFSEAFRVLRPGGRLYLADAVMTRQLSAAARARPDLWAA